MDYQKMKQLLITEFNKNDYQVLVKQNKRNSRSVKLTELSNQSAFLAYYPGYKAKVNSRGIYYDYRVDLQKEGNQVTLSHVNIIVDLYLKVYRNKELQNDLISMLGNTYQKGDIDPLIDTNHLSKYKPGKPPSTRVLGKLDEIHKEINKSYNSDGNQWDLEIEELYTAIGWIALQEDINYPQKRGYEGRKMPFSRYLEAVQYAAEDKPVKKIIHRALSHNRQTNLDDVDYSFIN